VTRQAAARSGDRHQQRAYREGLGRISWFRGAFELVIGRPCDRHQAPAGVSCWPLLNGHRSVCQARIQQLKWTEKQRAGSEGPR
jgi:hypothetical protein